MAASSIVTTVERASFDASTRQLLISSDHLISVARSYSSHFEPDYTVLLQRPPSESYQKTEGDAEKDGRPRKRRKRTQEQVNSQDFTPLEHLTVRQNDQRKSNTDRETNEHHGMIQDRLSEAIEAVRERFERESADRDGDEAAWLGDVGEGVRWIDGKQDDGKEFKGTLLSLATDDEHEATKEPVKLCSDEITELPFKGLPNRLVWNDSPAKVVEVRITDAQKSPSKFTLALPSSSAFLLQDFSRWSLPNSAIRHFGGQVGGWDLLVLDPPWPNASASRSSSYDTFDPYALGSLDVASLLLSKTSTRPTLVAVWLTNKIKYRRLVTTQLFPSWRIAPSSIASWYWIKTTTRGDPVWSLSSTHRRCYEPLLLGYSIPPKYDDKEHPLPALPKEKVFLGAPVGHSRKPTLWDLVEPFVSTERKMNGKGRNVLELFARTAVGGPDQGKGVWLAVGNESCKFNVVEEGSGGLKGWLRRRDQKTEKGQEDQDAT